MARLTIDRCLCFGKPFADLADVAAETGAATVPDLQEHALFGRKCALCHPYVRRMLRTGQTVFHEVVTDADEPEADASRPASSSTTGGAYAPGGVETAGGVG